MFSANLNDVNKTDQSRQDLSKNPQFSVQNPKPVLKIKLNGKLNNSSSSIPARAPQLDQQTHLAPPRKKAKKSHSFKTTSNTQNQSSSFPLDEQSLSTLPKVNDHSTFSKSSSSYVLQDNISEVSTIDRINIEELLDEPPSIEVPDELPEPQVEYIYAKKDLFSRDFRLDMGSIQMKNDADQRPFWLTEEGIIIVQNFGPLVEQAKDFLTAVAVPLSRPSFVHEYQLTQYSLYAAAAVGLESGYIIDVFRRLCKHDVPECIIKFINHHTANCGKLKVVLREGKYYLESSSIAILRKVIKDPIVKAAADKAEAAEAQTNSNPSVVASRASTPSVKDLDDDDNIKTENGENADLDEEDDNSDTFNIQIDSESVQQVKKRCQELGTPILEEYDFRRDHQNATLNIDIKQNTLIRPYQEKCLSQVFANGRARSGIVVLPCGAGKTLVGIVAGCTIKKNVLVLCTSAVSCEQWKEQFRTWSSTQANQIAIMTSDRKEKFSTASGIMICTYTMVAFNGTRAAITKKMMDFIESTEWGLLILDEVHVVPANMFQKVLTKIKAHATLGLTATLVREDEKIDNLNYLIGPKIYEANWMDLANKGFIAQVLCAEVWCDMTPEFYREYLNDEKSVKKRLFCSMNPNKFRVCEFLIKYHEARGDKIIIFSDNLFALERYAKKFNKPYICGATKTHERLKCLESFRHNANCSTLFLSKVGDTSIDLPEATCLIQISSHYGSRRQEAQRLGRILRASKRSIEGFKAHFYSLISKDTEDMYYSAKRRQFLIDQGYAFHLLPKIQEVVHQCPNLCYSSAREQTELLHAVLMANEAAACEEQLNVVDDLAFAISRRGISNASKPSGRHAAIFQGKGKGGLVGNRNGANQGAQRRPGANANNSFNQSRHKKPEWRR